MCHITAQVARTHLLPLDRHLYPYVSRQHARLDRQGSIWMIVDLNSTTGTYVNRVRVARWPLRPGDQIQIGQAVVVFQQGIPGQGGGGWPLFGTIGQTGTIF